MLVKIRPFVLHRERVGELAFGAVDGGIIRFVMKAENRQRFADAAFGNLVFVFVRRQTDRVSVQYALSIDCGKKGANY